MKLDEFDLKLLDALQRDSSRTNSELGEAVGLSASQISRRRERLEAEGAISGYRADLDASRLGFAVTVFVHVTLAAHSAGNSELLRKLILTTPEIQEAHAMTGDTDYLLRVSIRGLADLSAFVNERLLPHKAVARVRSEIVLETIKDERLLVL
ncbi:MAG: Lrp/AsnC family transcriptional regulator [Beijerinckiaceae bacterium]